MFCLFVYLHLCLFAFVSLCVCTCVFACMCLRLLVCVCKELLLKDEECERLSKVRDQLGQELEELTASLFQVGAPPPPPSLSNPAHHSRLPWPRPLVCVSVPLFLILPVLSPTECTVETVCRIPSRSF